MQGFGIAGEFARAKMVPGRGGKICCYRSLLQGAVLCLLAPANAVYCGTVINADIGLGYYATAGQPVGFEVGRLYNGDLIDLLGPVKSANQPGNYGGMFCYAEVSIDGRSFWSKLHEQACASGTQNAKDSHLQCSDIECELKNACQRDVSASFTASRYWFIHIHEC
jgi:hypothetical protein